MFLALNDCEALLSSAKHLEDPRLMVNTFEAEVKGYLKEKVLIMVSPFLSLYLYIFLYLSIYLSHSLSFSLSFPLSLSLSLTHTHKHTQI
jgi:hypothetical protein